MGSIGRYLCKVVCGAILVLLPVLAFATETKWVSIADNSKVKALQFHGQSNSFQQFLFHASTPGFNVTQVRQGETTYQKLSLDGATVNGMAGRPEMPGFTRMVMIPQGAKVSISVREKSVVALKDLLIYPAQFPKESEKIDPFYVDAQFYKMDKYYPEKLYTVSYDAVRGCRVAIVRVNTARYNPVKRQLIAYPDLEIDIKFEGGQSLFILDEMRSRFFDESYLESFANYSIAAIDMEALFPGRPFDERCDMLIITPPELLAPAMELAEWKVEKGIITSVVTLRDIEAYTGGTTAENIRNYIKTVYRNGNLSYVLLIGDADIIPTFYGSIESYSEIQIATDLYYAEMDDEGHLPDLAVGRISVELPADAPDQAIDVIRKIIDYEQNPPGNREYYRTILHCAGFEDMQGGSDDPFTWASDGRAEKKNVETMEEIRDYFLFSGEYTHLTRLYATGWGYWSEDPLGPQLYADGTPLPEELRYPNYPWDKDTYDLMEELEQGAFLTLYRGHGDFYQWKAFGNFFPEVWEEYEDNYPSVFLSITCKTGWFDMETDDPANPGNDNAESLAETFLRMRNGAAAIVAASRVSSGHANDWLIKGFIDYFWNGMVPYYSPDGGGSAYGPGRSKRLGDALNYAKMYMASELNDTFETVILNMYEEYHLFGDPSMEMWTASPYIDPVREVIDPVVLEPFPVEDLRYVLPIERDGVVASIIYKNEVLGQGISKNGKVMIYVDQRLDDYSDLIISFNKPGYLTQVVPIKAVKESDGK